MCVQKVNPDGNGSGSVAPREADHPIYIAELLDEHPVVRPLNQTGVVIVPVAQESRNDIPHPARKMFCGILVGMPHVDTREVPIVRLPARLLVVPVPAISRLVDVEFHGLPPFLGYFLEDLLQLGFVLFVFQVANLQRKF